MRIRNEGFSSIELLVVASLLMITSGIAVIRLSQSIMLLDADKAANQVSGQMRYARQAALDGRRNVVVEFLGTNQIKVTRQDSPDPTVLYDGTLPGGYVFGRPSGLGDTPDNYGNAQAVDFNMQTSGIFRGDGIFTDDAGIVMNGTVFTIAQGNTTARAVTLAGATGRIKTHAVAGSTWITR